MRAMWRELFRTECKTCGHSKWKHAMGMFKCAVEGCTCNRYIGPGDD